MVKRLLIFGLLLICLASSFVMAADTATAPAGILYTEPLESVIFSHQDHVQQGASCNICHSGLFEMEARRVQENKDFTMDSLYKGKYCGACHNGKKAFASDTQCARCHLGSGARVAAEAAPAYPSSVPLGKGGQGVAFNHETHIKKATCRSCHPSLFKPKAGTSNIGMADHRRGKSCFACHGRKGKNTFAVGDCSRCHTKSIPVPKEAVTFGRGNKAVVFRHESHQPKAGCKACHPRMFSFRKGTAKIVFNDHLNGRSCFTCHDRQGKQAFAVGDCSRCHTQSIPFPKEAVTFGKESKTGAVTFRHQSHQLGSGCQACHPKLFSFKKGTAKMGFNDHMKGQYCFTCHAQKNGSAFYNCNRCHKK